MTTQLMDLIFMYFIGPIANNRILLFFHSFKRREINNQVINNK